MLFLALLFALASAPQDLSLAPALADARVEADVERIELGEPFELRLEVVHRAGSTPQIDATQMESDAAWAVFEGGARATLPDPRREGDAITKVSWTVAALEPGELSLPAPSVRLETSTGESSEVEVARGALEVRAVLAPGEDTPRPLIGFVGLEPEPKAGLSTPLVVLALALVALGAWLLVRAARRHAARAQPIRTPTPMELLEALEQRELDRPELVNAAHYELTRALRAHLDTGLTGAGMVPDAWTDEEWLAHASERFDVHATERLERLFAECAQVKYGGGTPSHWAVRERVESARRLALELGGSQEGLVPLDAAAGAEEARP